MSAEAVKVFRSYVNRLAFQHFTGRHISRSCHLELLVFRITDVPIKFFSRLLAWSRGFILKLGHTIFFWRLGLVFRGNQDHVIDEHTPHNKFIFAPHWRHMNTHPPTWLSGSMVFVICAEDQRTKGWSRQTSPIKQRLLAVFVCLTRKHVQKSSKILSVNNSAARWNAARRSMKIENWFLFFQCD